MPSFLSKVFGRKKDDKESPRSQGRASDSSLLEGKFESVSPSATKFPEVPNGKGNGHGKEKEKDGFALFRAKSRPASPDVSEKRIDVPQLSLNLPGPKEGPTSRALGVVFEGDPDAQIILGDGALGGRRLNPLETLILIRACSQAITTRGLETLGIMHPHWYSASPDIQRRLISLFIQSLAPKSPITTLSPTPTAFISAFESEISSTRSPHDVAAVLRWGLRHLKLEGNTFGKEDGWYNNFFEAERTSEYPANAFSTHLPPQLPAAHLELLTATLEILSALAARAETNGISGSKLSKFFGLWLLTSQRAEEKDDWSTFYARWERSGRMLEHLFLSRIRDEASRSRMPTRLLELVHQYPYNKNSTPPLETGILSRPRFSTRRYDALFVQIETELSATAKQPQHHPLRLIAEAFKATSAASTPNSNLWEIIKKTGTEENSDSPGAYPGLSHIFADETIRFLSLIPIDNNGSEPTSPTFSLFLPQQALGASRRRSFSMSDGDKAAAVAAAASSSASPTTRHTKPATEPNTLPSASPTDWAEFSTSGFFENSLAAKPLASTLFDKERDMEVTLPKPAKRTKGSPVSLASSRKSLDTPRSAVIQETPIEEKMVSKTTVISITQLDEAFIDFWSDALLDPVSSDWPSFIICKLKSNLSGVEHDGKKLDWLVIEQSFKRLLLPNTSQDGHSAESSRRPRASSPKPSFKSDTTGSARKRFSFFTSRNSMSSIEKSTKGRKKAGHSPRVGEMGEVLAEEDERVETVKLRVPSPKPKKSMDVPRKSVDVSGKSGENGKANGVEGNNLIAGATVVAGAAVVGGVAIPAAIASSEATQADPTPAPLADQSSLPADATPLVEVLVSKPEAALPAEAEVSEAPQVPTKVDDETTNVLQPESKVHMKQNGHTHNDNEDITETPVAEPIPAPIPPAAVPVRAASPIVHITPREPTPEPEPEAAIEVAEDIPAAKTTPVPPAEVPTSVPSPEESVAAREPTSESTPAPIQQDEIPAGVISPEELVVAREPTPEPAVVAEAGVEASAPVVDETTPAVVAPVVVEDSETEPEEPTHEEPAPVVVAEETPATTTTSDAELAEKDTTQVEPPAQADEPVEAAPPVEAEAELVPEIQIESEPSTENKASADMDDAPVQEVSTESPKETSTTEEASATPVLEPQTVVEPEVRIADETVVPTEASADTPTDDTHADTDTPEPVVVDEPIVHTEPLHVPENDAADHDVALPAVPIVEAEPVHVAVEPNTPATDDALEVTPTEDSDPPMTPPAAEDSQEMPPAPESVVAAGETPGPQLALDTSESAALSCMTDEHTLDAPTDADETPANEAAPLATQLSPETSTVPETTIPEASIPERPITPPPTN